MSGSLFFVSVLGYMLLAMLILPRLKAGAALLCAVCGMLFASFWGVIMAEWMIPTAYIVLYGGLACLAVGAAAAVMNRRNLRARLLSPGLWFFLAAAAACVACYRHFLLQDHDVLSYWGRAIKELYTFDRFYIHADSNMFHTDYIPLMASLQYSVMRVFGWSDAYACYIPAACVAASVAAVADLLPRKKWFAFIASIVLFYAYGAFGFDLGGLRADGPMLIVFTAGLLTLLAREDDTPSSFVPAMCACAVLTGFKIYSGLMYAAVIAVAMAVECLSVRKRKLPWRAIAVMTLVSVVLIAALQFGWSIRYNAARAAASVEAAAARAAYLGQEISAAQADVSVGQLLSGNPRTAQLLQSFTPEKIEQFLLLAEQTFVLYGASKLVWLWPFVLAAVVLSFFTPKEKRRVVLKSFLFLLIAAIIFLLGLFGSYFVQAETAPAATGYLATASAPLLMGSVFFACWLMQGKLRVPCFIVLIVMTVGLVLLCPFMQLLHQSTEEGYVRYAALAHNFYETEIAGQLTPEDAGKNALLIECTYEAAQIKSQSGKTHAYGYFALPVRVTEPVYYVYGDYTQLENGIDGEYLMQLLRDRRCELLILRIEDELYWDEVAYALDLYGDWDGPVGVYDVSYEDELFSFTFRGGEEEFEE